MVRLLPLDSWRSVASRPCCLSSPLTRRPRLIPAHERLVSGPDACSVSNRARSYARDQLKDQPAQP